MNTLSKEQTARWFASAEDYRRLRLHWRGLMNSPRRHELGPHHHLLYLALLGKDWRKAFTLCSNPKKLANGGFAGWAMWRATDIIQWSRWAERAPTMLQPFDGLITVEMLQAIAALLPQHSSYKFKPTDFADGYPFEAYTLGNRCEPAFLDTE